MKVTNGWISNSSSSSFIVIAPGFPTLEEQKTASKWAKQMLEDYTLDEDSYESNLMVLPNYHIGETEFGWDERTYKNLGDKLNFCAIQILELKRYVDEGYEIYAKDELPFGLNIQLYEDMLKDVCKTYMNIDIRLKYNEDCYIDHQSCSTEGENMDMFKDKDSLEKFLFNPESHIVGDNDNH